MGVLLPLRVVDVLALVLSVFILFINTDDWLNIEQTSLGLCLH